MNMQSSVVVYKTRNSNVIEEINKRIVIINDYITHYPESDIKEDIDRIESIQRFISQESKNVQDTVNRINASMMILSNQITKLQEEKQNMINDHNLVKTQYIDDINRKVKVIVGKIKRNDR